MENIRQIVQNALRWRHNEHGDVSNHRRLDCLFNRLSRRKSKKIWKLRVSGLCERNLPMNGGFPWQSASSAETVSIWWRQNVKQNKTFANLSRCTISRRWWIWCQCIVWGTWVVSFKVWVFAFIMLNDQCDLYPWWRHQVETFSALLALCARNSPVTGEFPS